ncbi:hypothetical protein ONE63_007180 [Megalurothrips usitatus]|uniref:Single domain-containing protein n=1 Tax=Megalurothrips usitatus TaxID=439358 RepID=A0AAV7XXN1_9NEOP|nr:hypothetical protein ONE63_007180 [Megalurothrips usitatus]
MLGQRFLLCALACLLLVAAVSADCGDKKNGETWKTGPPDTCAQYTCKDGVIKGKTCSTMNPGNCKIKEGPAGSVFPDCCPTVEC